MKKQCCFDLPGLGGQCLRMGTAEHDGKFYCWQHDPTFQENLRIKKREERLAQYKRQAEEEEKLIKEEKRKELMRLAKLHLLTESELMLIIEHGGILEIVQTLG